MVKISQWIDEKPFLILFGLVFISIGSMIIFFIYNAIIDAENSNPNYTFRWEDLWNILGLLAVTVAILSLGAGVTSLLFVFFRKNQESLTISFKYISSEKVNNFEDLVIDTIENSLKSHNMKIIRKNNVKLRFSNRKGIEWHFEDTNIKVYLYFSKPEMKSYWIILQRGKEDVNLIKYNINIYLNKYVAPFS